MAVHVWRYTSLEQDHRKAIANGLVFDLQLEAQQIKCHTLRQHPMPCYQHRIGNAAVSTQPKTTRKSKKRNLNQTRDSPSEMPGNGERMAASMQVARNTKLARTQKMFVHPKSFSKKHRTMKAIAKNESQASPGVRSIKRINGPASQRIWTNRFQGFMLAKAAFKLFDAPLRSSFMQAIDKFVVHLFLRQDQHLPKNFKSIIVTELFKVKQKNMPIERQNLRLTYC